MAIAFPEEQHPPAHKRREDAEPETLTIDDIYASIGQGTPPDLEGGVFHASTEDFIAAMRARRQEAAQ